RGRSPGGMRSAGAAGAGDAALVVFEDGLGVAAAGVVVAGEAADGADGAAHGGDRAAGARAAVAGGQRGGAGQELLEALLVALEGGGGRLEGVERGLVVAV